MKNEKSINKLNEIETYEWKSTLNLFIKCINACLGVCVCVCVLNVHQCAHLSKIDSKPFESIWRSFEHCDKCQVDDPLRIQNPPMLCQPKWIYHSQVNTIRHHYRLPNPYSKIIKVSADRFIEQISIANVIYLDTHLVFRLNIQHKTSPRTIQRKCFSFYAIWGTRWQLKSN